MTNDKILADIRRQFAKVRADFIRIDYGDVVDLSPLMVTFDGEVANAQPAYTPDGVAVELNDRVAVFRSGNAPGIVAGRLSGTGGVVDTGLIGQVPPPSGDVTGAEDFAAIQVVIDELDDRGGGTVKLAQAPLSDPYMIAGGILEYPEFVSMVGEGGWASIIQCVDSDAGLRFGPVPAGAESGMPKNFNRIAGFQLDGNGAGVTPLDFNANYAVIEDVVVRGIDGHNSRMLGQNCLVNGLHLADCNGSNMVFDNGTGGHTFIGCNWHFATEYQLLIQQLIPYWVGFGLYDVPKAINFFSCLFEASGSLTFGTAGEGLGTVHQTAGSNMRFRDTSFVHENPDTPAYLIERDDTDTWGGDSLNGQTRFRSCTFIGSVGRNGSAVQVGQVDGSNNPQGIAIDYAVIDEGENIFSGFKSCYSWRSYSPLMVTGYHLHGEDQAQYGIEDGYYVPEGVGAPPLPVVRYPSQFTIGADGLFMAGSQFMNGVEANRYIMTAPGFLTWIRGLDQQGVNEVKDALRLVGRTDATLTPPAGTMNFYVKVVAGVDYLVAMTSDGVEHVLSSEGGLDLSAYQLLAQKDQPSGYAGLDGSGKLATSAIPALALVDVSVVASQVAQLALTAQEGDVAVRTDESKAYIHNGGTAGTMADWTLLLTPTDIVLSVFGRTGAVTQVAGDYTAAQVTNTPAGGIAGTTVQAAIDELDAEKLGEGSLWEATQADADDAGGGWTINQATFRRLGPTMTWVSLRATNPTFPPDSSSGAGSILLTNLPADLAAPAEDAVGIGTVYDSVASRPAEAWIYNGVTVWANRMVAHTPSGTAYLQIDFVYERVGGPVPPDPPEFVAAADESASYGTVTLPATQADDIVLIAVGQESAAGDPGGLVGTFSPTRTLLEATEPGVGTREIYTYWARCTGDHAGETIQHFGGRHAVVAIYRGAKATGDPFEAARSEDSDTGSTTTAPASFDTTEANTKVILVTSTADGSWSAQTKDGNAMTERVDAGNVENAGKASISDKVQAGAGATGAFSATRSSSTGAASSQALALIPEPV